VQVQGNTPGQIRQMALAVFQSNGYEATRMRDANLVFEKPGSGLNNLAYGNWNGTPVWVRVHTAIVPVSEGAYRLEGKTVLVRDRGGATEEEVKLQGASATQKLLEEVARRLKAPQ